MSSCEPQQEARILRILFVGDIVGRGGRKIFEKHIGSIIDQEHIDFTIVNVENAAGGFGLTPKLGEKILSAGADVMTSGNHIWDRSEVFDYFDRQPRLLRPGNYPPGTPGAFSIVAETRTGAKVATINLQGRVFMPAIDCPFRSVDKQIETLRQQTPIIVVDFHAEATSEKMAFGWHVDGRVSAMLGTHTHIPTADTRILPRGTAYVTDVGMTGPYDSVIGMTVESSLPRFLTGRRSRFEPETKNPRLCSVVVEVDERSGEALSIRRYDVRNSAQD